jgi:prepilin peptidase CpaA
MQLISPLWLLLPIIPIAVWVAWSDMKVMKIPNKAVMAMAGVWVAFGWLTVSWTDWAWGFAIMGIVLAVGFVMSTFRMLGAGDAKFAAAIAPFFVGADPLLVMGLVAASLLGAFVVHRILRGIPAVRSATPDWISWTHSKFPGGLALAAIIIIYHLAAFWPQG